MVNDPIGDMITQIRNAARAGKQTLCLPYSKMKRQVAEILAQEGYVDRVQFSGDIPKKILSMDIRYDGKTPVLIDIKRKSKPGLRIYINKRSIPMVVGGMGVAIMSTPEGIMTGKEAKKRGIGGELLCEVW